jgi:hypothetical protein
LSLLIVRDLSPLGIKLFLAKNFYERLLKLFVCCVLQHWFPNRYGQVVATDVPFEQRLAGAADR